MGDLVLALPSIRAYAREHGSVDLITSALCVPLVPLLWECPYIKEVHIDATQPYEADGKVLLQWNYFKNKEGINLSPQPSFREEEAPYYYSDCYSRALDVTPLAEDYMIFPSLVNNRRWFASHEVFYKGKSQSKMKTIVVAPECESVSEMSVSAWQDLIDRLYEAGFSIIVIGKNKENCFSFCTDLRGQTTIPTVARIISESHALIGSHSFPMQLASRIEVPTFCFQEMILTLDRANPLHCNTVYFDEKGFESSPNYYLKMIKGDQCVSA